jgi:hypothetical protein
MSHSKTIRIHATELNIWRELADELPEPSVYLEK